MAFDLPTNFTMINGTNSSTVDGVGSLFQYASYATGNTFGVGILIIIFLMSFGVSALMNIGRAFASASFITFIFSIYFARIGALNPTYPYLLLLMTIVGFFWAKSERSASY